jgi:hypothetical protein
MSKELASMFLFFLNISIFSQHNFNFVSLEKNDANLRSLIKLDSGRHVIFFCPISDFRDETYRNKIDVFSNELIYSDSLCIDIVFYLEDPIETSKGLKICSKDSTKCDYINQFECFLSGFDETKLLRSHKVLSNNFQVKKQFSNENLYKISLVEKSYCLPSLPARIPVFADFIKETLNPNYSYDEKIQFLRDSIKILFGVINEMNEKLKKMEAEISNHKPNNQEKSKSTEPQAIQNNSDNRKKKN